MEFTARKFTDFEAADRATLEYYRSLTPAQRLDILLELVERAQENDDAARQGLAPVYRTLNSHGVEYLIVGAHALASSSARHL